VSRTSSYQEGVINSNISYVDFGDHETREWAVVKLLGMEDEEWITNGIGVDGDSGTWIIDSTTHQLYGVVWGRDGEGAKTVTYYTSMTEIIADMKERLGDPEIRLPH